MGSSAFRQVFQLANSEADENGLAHAIQRFLVDSAEMPDQMAAIHRADLIEDGHRNNGQFRVPVRGQQHVNRIQRK
jgi:hypothetical protein